MASTNDFSLGMCERTGYPGVLNTATTASNFTPMGKNANYIFIQVRVKQIDNAQVHKLIHVWHTTATQSVHPLFVCDSLQVILL